MASRRYEIGVGLLLLASLAAAGFMALRIGALSGLGNRVDVTVEIEDAAGLTPGAVVAVAGVEVGTVSDMRVADGVAVVGLSLDPDAGLRTDARARIRARSVLGERYVELEPRSGNAPLLQDGDRLPRVGVQTEIDEIVNALGPILDRVDPELVGRLFDALGRAIEEDPERLDRMLDNADVLLANLALASEEAPAMMRDGRAALGAVERAAAEVDARAGEAEAVIARADRTLDDLEAAAEPLPDVVRDAGAAIDEARTALQPLGPASEDIAKIAEALAGLDEAQIERLLREEGVRVRLFGPGKKKQAED